ncbi:MAG: hypothetical protein Q8L09_03370, partial [Candidatus Moranbacteria bacterium]|nr:hypothetical protein [Candidatus Moranbacteria bacterium]
DRQKPKFVDLPRTLNKNPGDTVTWTVTDNDQIGYYQYTFRGKKVKTNDNSFVLPAGTPKGISRLTVRAYDRAKNMAKRRVKIKVE